MTPIYTNLAKEVIRNAIRSANEAPRFDPVTKRELLSLTLSVDVLTTLEKINDLDGHNVKQFGLLVRENDK